MFSSNITSIYWDALSHPPSLEFPISACHATKNHCNWLLCIPHTYTHCQVQQTIFLLLDSCISIHLPASEEFCIAYTFNKHYWHSPFFAGTSSVNIYTLDLILDPSSSLLIKTSIRYCFPLCVDSVFPVKNAKFIGQFSIPNRKQSCFQNNISLSANSQDSQ